jgi:RNA polymerase sigma-70 factor (ECF subfamily)
MTDARQDFEALLMPLLDAAFGLALHLTRNRADAEDLLQDGVVNALRAYDRFEPGTNFKAWFYRILTNRFHDLYRKRRPERNDCSLEHASELFVLLRSKEAGLDLNRTEPDVAAFRHIEMEHVAAALHQLPEEFRMVATLYFVEDFRYQDMAELLDIPIGTVRSRLHRARRMLQKLLWQIAEDSGLVTASSAVGAGGAV